LAKLAAWLAGPLAWLRSRADAFRDWRERMQARSFEKARERDQRRFGKEQPPQKRVAVEPARAAADTPPWQTREERQTREETASPAEESEPLAEDSSTIEEIPIVPVEDMGPDPEPFAPPVPATATTIHLAPVAFTPDASALREPA